MPWLASWRRPKVVGHLHSHRPDLPEHVSEAAHAAPMVDEALRTHRRYDTHAEGAAHRHQRRHRPLIVPRDFKGARVSASRAATSPRFPMLKSKAPKETRTCPFQPARATWLATIHALALTLALTLALVPARVAGIDGDIAVVAPGRLVEDVRSQLPANCSIAALCEAGYAESSLALAAAEEVTHVRVSTFAYQELALCPPSFGGSPRPTRGHRQFHMKIHVYAGRHRTFDLTWLVTETDSLRT